MCRHLAYVGAPAPLGDWLVDAPHGLVDQARAPRWQTSGKDNPDGYGVAWWTAYDDEDGHTDVVIKNVTIQQP